MLTNLNKKRHYESPAGDTSPNVQVVVSKTGSLKNKKLLVETKTEMTHTTLNQAAVVWHTVSHTQHTSFLVR